MILIICARQPPSAIVKALLLTIACTRTQKWEEWQRLAVESSTAIVLGKPLAAVIHGHLLWIFLVARASPAAQPEVRTDTMRECSAMSPVSAAPTTTQPTLSWNVLGLYTNQGTNLTLQAKISCGW